MLWVKRLADHVTQDLLGQPDLEFAWGDLTPADPAEQAKIIDTYVRDGVYAVNEARGLLGLDPVPGGDQPMIYGTQGAVPLGAGAAKAAGGMWLHKYNPDEPRVPAGSPQGGQWTSAGGDEGGSEPPDNGRYQPGGTISTPIEGTDPLDPQGLNTEPSPEEQQRIADTVTAIQQGDIGGLQPHSYQNLPDRATGAVLPPSTTGYTTYGIKGAGPGRGEARMLIDKSTGAVYYTSNHYKSFYPVLVAPTSGSTR
jgi:guanyl-specific ribonuclease Sa